MYEKIVIKKMWNGINKWKANYKKSCHVFVLVEK